MHPILSLVSDRYPSCFQLWLDGSDMPWTAATDGHRIAAINETLDVPLAAPPEQIGLVTAYLREVRDPIVVSLADLRAFCAKGCKRCDDRGFYLCSCRKAGRAGYQEYTSRSGRLKTRVCPVCAKSEEGDGYLTCSVCSDPKSPRYVYCGVAFVADVYVDVRLLRGLLRTVPDSAEAILCEHGGAMDPLHFSCLGWRAALMPRREDSPWAPDGTLMRRFR